MGQPWSSYGGQIPVTCQYLRCTVTWTTQLSCPASLVAMHWYNPVLICVRFFRRTCPGLEMSETGKTKPGLIKEDEETLTVDRTQKHELTKSVQEQSMMPHKRPFVNLQQNTGTLHALPCSGWSTALSGCSSKRHCVLLLSSHQAIPPSNTGSGSTHACERLSGFEHIKAPRSDLTYWLLT